MAKTLRQIQISFDNAKALARELDQVASDLKQIRRVDVENAFANTAGAWKGDNANAFFHKVRPLQEKSARLAEDYQAFANEIRRVAQIIYNAEKRAWEIAQVAKG